VGLEGLNGTLGGIAMMDIWRDKLVTYFPCVLNGGLEFGTDFVAKDLEVNVVATVG
jgi:hypothetical protein